MCTGRLGSEPQLKYLDSGSCVLSVSLAVRKEMMRNAATAGQMDREEVSHRFHTSAGYG